MPEFHAIIPAGGPGTRLWPLSREDHPKFLLDLTGTGRTLLQQTWDRLEPLTGPDKIHVVAGVQHAAAIREQLPHLHHLITEPHPRGTMPAIGLAALHIAHDSPDAVIGSFAADHVITDPEAFRDTVRHCIAVAGSGGPCSNTLCTIGVRPAHPTSAYGYIRTGGLLGPDDAPAARAVTGFVEKPPLETAAAYVASGGWLWNSGIFIATAPTMLRQLEAYRPDLLAGLRAYTDGSRTWEQLAYTTIDRALAEPAARDGALATVPGDFGWRDVGDLTSLEGDDASALWHDASGTVINRTGRAITVAGIEEAIVVDTGDALLVTTREYAQHVQDLPQLWRDRGRPDVT